MNKETVHVEELPNDGFEISVVHNESGSAYSFTLSRFAFSEVRRYVISNLAKNKYCQGCSRENEKCVCDDQIDLSGFIKLYWIDEDCGCVTWSWGNQIANHIETFESKEEAEKHLNKKTK